MATSEGIPASIDIEFLELNDNPYVMVCKNCGERIRTTPRRRSNDVVYDASVKSLVVYLSVVQFLPYGRIASFYMMFLVYLQVKVHWLIGLMRPKETHNQLLTR